MKSIGALKPNEVFVFGSNTEGRHGAGAARTALVHYGAIYGQARGLQGQSYAIVTKDLLKGKRSIPLETIQKEIDQFFEFAKEHPELIFYVTPIGCGLAGFMVDEIAPLFQGKNVANVVLPEEFKSMAQEYSTDEISIIDLVDKFFKNKNQSILWLKTINPLLGGISPKEMIDRGRYNKLFKFIETAMAENNRK